MGKSDLERNSCHRNHVHGFTGCDQLDAETNLVDCYLILIKINAMKKVICYNQVIELGYEGFTSV